MTLNRKNRLKTACRSLRLGVGWTPDESIYGSSLPSSCFSFFGFAPIFAVQTPLGSFVNQRRFITCLNLPLFFVNFITTDSSIAYSSYSADSRCASRYGSEGMAIRFCDGIVLFGTYTVLRIFIL